MTTKMRVYEVARDLGLENKALVALLQSVLLRFMLGPSFRSTPRARRSLRSTEPDEGRPIP